MEVKRINTVLFIVALIKVIGGLLTHSYTMIATALLEVSLILISLIGINKSEKVVGKKILSGLVGLLMILSSVGLFIVTLNTEVKKVSWFIILFVLITLIVKYITNCYYTNLNYRKRVGILSFSNLNSTIDFILMGIILGAFIIIRISRWFDILKYADIVGTALVLCFVIYKGVIVIINTFKGLENKDYSETIDKYKIEIEARKEIKKIHKFDIKVSGGVRYANVGIELTSGITMIDVNTFIVTLQDYLLKIVDVAKVSLVDPDIKVKKPKVRSLKEDARNSRSRNSKTNTKKKNSKQKNKKR